MSEQKRRPLRTYVAAAAVIVGASFLQPSPAFAADGSGAESGATPPGAAEPTAAAKVKDLTAKIDKLVADNQAVADAYEMAQGQLVQAQAAAAATQASLAVATTQVNDAAADVQTLAHNAYVEGGTRLSVLCFWPPRGTRLP